MPRYRQKIKREKPRKREIKVWDNESSEMLQAAFDITDWDVFRDECDDIHELTDTINSYVTFCEDLHIQSKEIKIYPNGKPWFNGKIKATIKEKKNEFKNGNHDRVKELNREIKRQVSEAKRKYGEKLERCFKTNNPRNAWKCLEAMTDYSNKKHGNTFEHEQNVKEKANELNSFFCRFENQDRQEELDEQLAALRNRVDDSEPFVIHESDVRKRFQAH